MLGLRELRVKAQNLWSESVDL